MEVARSGSPERAYKCPGCWNTRDVASKPARFRSHDSLHGTRYKRPARPTLRQRTLDDEIRVRGDRHRRRGRSLATARRRPSAIPAADEETHSSTGSGIDSNRSTVSDDSDSPSDRTDPQPDSRRNAESDARTDPDPVDSSLPPCPRCGNPVADVRSTGPHSHNVSPCGCPLTATEVTEL